MKRLIKKIFSRRGSSTIFFAMIFVAFAICISSAILISRQITLSSKCEIFGRLWARAILSEYDRNLLNDYGIMAYFGNEVEIRNIIDNYLDYSIDGKLDARLSYSESSLTGLELSNIDNFRKAMKQGFTSGISIVISDAAREKRNQEGITTAEDGSIDSEGKLERAIGNQIVIDTLPSNGRGGSSAIDEIVDIAKKLKSSDEIRGALTNAGADVAFLYMYFDNQLSRSCKPKDSWFSNEWEYVIEGELNDEGNRKATKHKLFLIRNALNLISLYQDSAKVEAITAIAELITPGPAGILTQAVIAEAWAALEAEADVDDLYENKRVPVIKSSDQWKYGLGRVMDSKDVKDALDEDAISNMEGSGKEIEEITNSIKVTELLSSGLNYDEYLLLMILSMNEDIRILRIMDLVQINMKYRYYRDFNLMEYFTGVRFSFKVNGKVHSFEDAYK